MTTEIIVISLIVFLTFVSITLGIINWALLASTSSKISGIEEEIEKKAKEFASIKRDRTPPQNQPSIAMEKPGPVEQFSVSSSFVSQENPGIEIVRNVRAGFEQPHSEFSAPASAPGSASPPADVLDIVDDGERLAPDVPEEADTIEIMLFSPIKKDTDFAGAWKKLTETLPGAPGAQVRINFKNVMFLYDKELQYLDKIRSVVLKENGSLTFINCHPELRPIIAASPRLAPLLHNRRI